MAKKTNLTVNDGAVWSDLFNITAGIDDMEVFIKGGNGKEYCEGIYTGSGAITLANYNNFPVGSSIKDFQAYKTHYKTAATTWKSSAAAS